MKPDILLTNIGQVATLEGHSEKPKTGEEMNEVSVIEDGAIAIKDGKILAVGTTKEVISQVSEELSLPSIAFPGMLAACHIPCVGHMRSEVGLIFFKEKSTCYAAVNFCNIGVFIISTPKA